jgi:HAMP domain-containing protein
VESLRVERKGRILRAQLDVNGQILAGNDSEARTLSNSGQPILNLSNGAQFWEAPASAFTGRLKIMRVMVIIKANEHSENGVMPSEKLLTEMGNFNEELVNAGIMIAGEGLHVRVIIPLPRGPGEAEQRLLQGLFSVPGRVSALAANVQTAYSRYRELLFLREPLKYTFTLTLSLILVLSLLAAVWGAFYAARKLVAPIQDLAAGTRAVAKGDYQTLLPMPARDERSEKREAQARGLLDVMLETRHLGPLRVIVTHLEVRDHRIRSTQLREIKHLIDDGEPGPTVLLGDLNEWWNRRLALRSLDRTAELRAAIARTGVTPDLAEADLSGADGQVARELAAADVVVSTLPPRAADPLAAAVGRTHDAPLTGVLLD